ncbi:ComEC/Rec2 family competence protein [Alloscardovia omnicolens]|uniref:ComEC/Rec2 family competence protein n=1 Tax=Alloscardovia omnicolens TaxID=419015 RepID=UPI003A5F6961
MSCFISIRADVTDSVSAQTIGKARTVVAQLRMESPPLHSQMRGFECSVPARIERIHLNSRWFSSHSSVRFMGRSARDCSVENSGVYEVHGMVKPSARGSIPWILSVENKCSRCVRELHKPSIIHHAVAIVHGRFLAQTARLDATSALLVPGVTLGVTGQDALISTAGFPTSDTANKASEDASYAHDAHKIKQSFRTAGIMHVLAVSGGHFALAVSVVNWLTKRIQTPRWVRAMAMVCADGLVFVLMYPSDSLLRASIMVLFSSAYVLLGRRYDACAALCWTVILSILFNPRLSTSIGFALSCAAVLGIVTCARRIEKALNRVLPSSLAVASALTLSAQIVTIPISYLISPDIALYSVLSNLLVSIPMDIATVCGIVGLMVSWLCPAVGFVCVWLAGQATSVMAQISFLVSALPYAQVTCTPMMLIVLYGCSGASIAIAVFIIRWFRWRYRFESQYHLSYKERVKQWWFAFLHISGVLGEDISNSCPRWKGH